MSFISDLFDSSDNPNSLGAKFRNQRNKDFEVLFFKNFSKNEPIHILDLGGTVDFWKNSSLLSLPQLKITLLNLEAESTHLQNLESISGDATSMPQFGDQSFDLVFSNSVIEHLYTFENQQKMASEILRVGKKYFVQTPNKYFPIEAHYALPFAQYYPETFLRFLLTKTKVSRLRKWPFNAAQQYLDEIRLLDEKEMKLLFSGATIYREKFLGIIKSISAHNLD